MSDDPKPRDSKYNFEILGFLDGNMIDEIHEAIQARCHNFPDEPYAMSFFYVMLNIGERKRTLVSTNPNEEERWRGHVDEVTLNGDGAPVAPDGFPVVSMNQVRLAYVSIDAETDAILKAKQDA